MQTLREEAEELRLSLLMDLVEPADVIAWADRRIADLLIAPIEIINISLVSDQASDELTRLLRLVPGPADLTLAAHRVLHVLRTRLFGVDLPLVAVADRLWVYSSQADVPEAERLAAANFRYEFECLAYYGTPEGLGAEMEKFLAEHASAPNGDA